MQLGVIDQGAAPLGVEAVVAAAPPEHAVAGAADRAALVIERDAFAHRQGAVVVSGALFGPAVGAGEAAARLGRGWLAVDLTRIEVNDGIRPPLVQVEVEGLGVEGAVGDQACEALGVELLGLEEGAGAGEGVMAAALAKAQVGG